MLQLFFSERCAGLSTAFEEKPTLSEGCENSMAERTICAIATAMGSAGISVIRLSGQNPLEIAGKIFSGWEQIEPRKMVLGKIMDGETLVDEVLLVYFAAPASYTGEDVVEIHCHGGMVATQMILELLVKSGAQPAAPGEFTKRAFLNGKMDISRAEAVADLIAALSRKSASVSARQLRGDLYQEIKRLQSALTDVMAALEAGIEYPEEDLETSIAEAQLPNIKAILDGIGRLMNTYEQGKLLRDGIRVAIAGRPNVGKSSLLNAILGEERAIVTNIPGTTRDVVSEYVTIHSMPVVFLDTAGIRKTENAIEKIGVNKSLEVLREASITLFLLDAGEEITQEDKTILETIRQNSIPYIVVLNKTDLEKMNAADVRAALGEEPVEISAKSKTGIENLLEQVYNCAVKDEGLMEGVVITAERHMSALREAHRSLMDGYTALEEGIDLDCAAIDLRGAWQSLGEITGDTLDEDIIDRIFTKFCLGK